MIKNSLNVFNISNKINLTTVKITYNLLENKRNFIERTLKNKTNKRTLSSCKLKAIKKGF